MKATVTLPDSTQQTLPLFYATKTPSHVVAVNNAEVGWQIVKYVFSKDSGENIVQRIRDPKIYVDFSPQMRGSAIVLPVNL